MHDFRFRARKEFMKGDGAIRIKDAAAHLKEMGKVRWLDEYCHKCGSQMNSWDKRLTNTFKVKNTCEKCFCKIYDMDKDSFRDAMENFWGIRPCQGI